MSIFKYRPYYEWLGPSHADPLAEKLSDEDVERNIYLFFRDVENHFAEMGVKARQDGDLLVVEGDLSQKESHDIVAKYLVSLSLLAEKIGTP